jgi:hypothetical protein
MTKEEQVLRAWREADTVPGKSPERWRRDHRGRLMRRGSFGTRGRYAWTLGRPRAADAPALEATSARVREDVRQLQAMHESTFHHEGCKDNRFVAGNFDPPLAIDRHRWPPASAPF